jgi:Holliday junction resolvasome RuvABC ATP-dependent DNA helicase subunit
MESEKDRCLSKFPRRERLEEEKIAAQIAKTARTTPRIAMRVIIESSFVFARETMHKRSSSF